jgi:hypothetical protein
MVDLTCRAFRVTDVEDMRCRPEQEEVRANMQAQMEGMIDSARFGKAWTALDDGVPVFCAGMTPMWQGRAIAWALCGDVPRRSLRQLLVETRAELDRQAAAGTWRIEATVARGWWAAERFAEALGFDLRCVLPLYGPDRGDYGLWERLDQ